MNNTIESQVVPIEDCGIVDEYVAVDNVQCNVQIQGGLDLTISNQSRRECIWNNVVQQDVNEIIQTGSRLQECKCVLVKFVESLIGRCKDYSKDTR